MSLSFYQGIKEYYDAIFPLQMQQVHFTKSFLRNDSKLLEVGCANGKLSNALSETYKVTGIDLEADFIAVAKKNYGNNCRFQTQNMLDIKLLGEHFDGICCFGNTLAHLAKKEVNLFIAQTRERLNKRGTLLIQVVNYEHILRHNIKNLPLIDNSTIRFERSYNLVKKERLEFHTKLLIKAAKEEVKNKIMLTPITKNELIEILKSHGFTAIETFANFKKDPLTDTSMLLVIKAEI